jgi:hypothetical protein
MDGASSHRRQAEMDKLPTTNWRVDQLQEWLAGFGIPEDELQRANKTELLAMCEPWKQVLPKKYIAHEIARKAGHETHITPPYHLELQPIERVWCHVKNEIAGNPCSTMKELIERIENNFKTVTQKVLLSTFKQSQKWEDDYLALLDDQDVQVVPEAVAEPMDAEEEAAVPENDPLVYPDLDTGFDSGSDDDDIDEGYEEPL